MIDVLPFVKTLNENLREHVGSTTELYTENVYHSPNKFLQHILQVIAKENNSDSIFDYWEDLHVQSIENKEYLCCKKSNRTIQELE